MEITVTIGTWIFPMIATLSAFGLAWHYSNRQPKIGGNDFGAGGLIDAGRYGLALIASLILWLIWALFN